MSAQRGVALLVVLWACTLLAIMLGGYAMLARTEGLQARYQFGQTQARYYAEAGVMRALYELHGGDQKQQVTGNAQAWVPDGRLYVFHLDQAVIGITMYDENGKVNPNTAPPDLLERFFETAGADNVRAQALASAVVEWRTPVSSDSFAGEKKDRTAAGRYLPRHALFASIEELQAVPGMSQAIYAKVAPVVTLWSYQTIPSPLHASALVLASLPGMNMSKAQQFIAMREQAVQAGAGLPALPNGMSSGVAVRSGTVTIHAEAKMSDGIRAVLRVTVRSELAHADGSLPYTILRWQEGDEE